MAYLKIADRCYKPFLQMRLETFFKQNLVLSLEKCMLFDPADMLHCPKELLSRRLRKKITSKCLCMLIISLLDDLEQFHLEFYLLIRYSLKVWNWFLTDSSIDEMNSDGKQNNKRFRNLELFGMKKNMRLKENKVRPAMYVFVEAKSKC